MVHICAPLAPLVRCKNSPKGPLTLCHIKFCLDYLMQHWTKARIKAIQFSLQHGLLCYMYGGLLRFHGRELAFLKQWNYYYAFDTMDRRNDSVPHKNIFSWKGLLFSRKRPLFRCSNTLPFYCLGKWYAARRYFLTWKKRLRPWLVKSFLPKLLWHKIVAKGLYLQRVAYEKMSLNRQPFFLQIVLGKNRRALEL